MSNYNERETNQNSRYQQRSVVDKKQNNSINNNDDEQLFSDIEVQDKYKKKNNNIAIDNLNKKIACDGQVIIS